MGTFLAVDEYWAHDARSTLWAWPGMNPIKMRDPSGRIGLGDTNSSDRVIDVHRRAPEWHRCRNKHNVCPKHPPNTCSTERNAGWKFNVGGHSEWRSPLGYECTYDADGNLLPDVDGEYTYDYEPDAHTIRHGLIDWFAHYFFGGHPAYDSNLTTVVECE